MLRHFALDQYHTESLIALGLALLMGGIIVGYLTDHILGDRGFGPVGNGMLAVVGCFSGIYARNAFIGHIEGNELLWTGVIAAAGATSMLLTLGVIKHWVSD